MEVGSNMTEFKEKLSAIMIKEDQQRLMSLY